MATLRSFRSPFRIILLALCAGTPLLVSALDGELLTWARYYGADCEPVPAVKAIGSMPEDPAAAAIYGLLWGKDDWTDQRAPLMDSEELEAYASHFLQLTVTVAGNPKGGKQPRLLQALLLKIKTLDNDEPGITLFYLLRIMSILKPTDDEAAIKETFAAVKEAAQKPGLGFCLARLSALERFLALVKLDPVEQYIQQQSLARLYAETAVRLIDAGAFKAADKAIDAAAQRFGRSWKEVQDSLKAFLKNRNALHQLVKPQLADWRASPENARRWAMFLLCTFRRIEQAIPAMEASEDSILKNLTVLLKTQGGLIAAGDVLTQLAEGLKPQEADGLKLLALDLYEKASPDNDLPQAKAIRSTLEGRKDPLIMHRLPPEVAHRGVTLRLLTDPPDAFAYVDYMLQALPEALAQSPCRLLGVPPGKNRITVAGFGKRDAGPSQIKAEQGLILYKTQKAGISKLLEQSGKNMLLHQKIKVTGPLVGHMSLFDGEVRAADRQKGFAYNRHPCVFTLLLPRPISLSAIRVKLWDGDERTYKYMLDVSLDGRRFLRVADKSEGVPAGWQNILFPLQKVRVIKLHCLHNSANRSFQVLEVEGYTIASPEQMIKPVVDY